MNSFLIDIGNGLYIYDGENSYFSSRALFLGFCLIVFIYHLMVALLLI